MVQRVERLEKRTGLKAISVRFPPFREQTQYVRQLQCFNS
jgi:hypothetical protein